MEGEGNRFNILPNLTTASPRPILKREESSDKDEGTQKAQVQGVELVETKY